MQLNIWTPTGLVLPANLPYEGWEEIGRVLGRAEGAVQWWMGDWWRFGEHHYGERAAQAIDSRWSFQTWADAGWVADRIEPSRRREVLSHSHHREVAALEPDKQDYWLDQAMPDPEDEKQRPRLGHKELRAAIRRARPALIDPGSLPEGKFAVLLADPPWRYDFVEADNRAIENQYPTLTADEIACYEDESGRPVADLPADDAVLFLWATNPKLTEAFTVIEGWGFQYVTNLVWKKDRIGMGYWARQQHELLLIATRGSFSPPSEEARLSSVIEAPRTAHSAKPEEAYERIEAMFPVARRVEIFARAPRSGWAAWGNQT